MFYKPNNMKIKLVKKADEKLLHALEKLIPQLTPHGAPITKESIEAIINPNNDSELLIAMDSENNIVGTLTLVVFTIPTGKKAFIEDVIVDESARGLGLGKLLMEKAIEIAKEKKVLRIELSSRPMRVPANRLYLSMGFKVRETNFYRLELS